MENTKISRWSIKLVLLFGFSIPILLGYGIYFIYNNSNIQSKFHTYKKVYEVSKTLQETKNKFTEPSIFKAYRGQFLWSVDLPNEYIEHLRTNMLSLISSAKVKRIKLNNKESGYEITEIDNGSFFQKVELSVGDQLTHLNDVSIGSLDATAVISDTILNAKYAKLKFIRSGKTMTYEMRVIDRK